MFNVATCDVVAYKITQRRGSCDSSEFSETVFAGVSLNGGDASGKTAESGVTPLQPISVALKTALPKAGILDSNATVVNGSEDLETAQAESQYSELRLECRFKCGFFLSKKAVSALRTLFYNNLRREVSFYKKSGAHASVLVAFNHTCDCLPSNSYGSYNYRYKSFKKITLTFDFCSKPSDAKVARLRAIVRDTIPYGILHLLEDVAVIGPTAKELDPLIKFIRESAMS